jgi:predicted lipoprotein with Yx(FWY)xxD motif
MKNTSLALGLIVSSLLAGCGGGGGTSAAPGSPPITGPTTSSDALSTASLNGGPAFVTSANMPVYVFGGDKVANQSTCTGGCLSTWPAVAPPSGTLNAPWAAFTRTDNGTRQLTINGHALYTFVSDSPLVARGDNVENFHLARPAASSSTGGGTGGTGGGNTGPYP